MKLKVILIFLCLFIYPKFYGQICGNIYQEFDFGGKHDIWNTAVTVDNNIISVGSLNYPDGDMGALIFKSDANGSLKWAKTVKGRRLQIFRRVFALKDSGVLAVGATASFPQTNSFSGLLTKWDKNGNLVWSRVYTTNSQFGDWGLGVQELSNGDILFQGNNNSNGYHASGVVIKVSANGTFIWGKRFRFFEGINFRTSLEEDDGYLVAGDYLYNSNSTYRTVLVKLNKQDGSLNWVKSYYTSGNNISSGPLVKTEKGYVLNAGNYNTASAFGGFYRHHLIYLNNDLSPDKSFDVEGERISSRLSETNLSVLKDGSIVGASGGEAPGDVANLFSINATQQLVWSKKVSGQGGAQMSGVVPVSSNGDFVFVGTRTILGARGKVIWARTNLSSESNFCTIEPNNLKLVQSDLRSVVFNFEGIDNISSTNWQSNSPIVANVAIPKAEICNPTYAEGGGKFCFNSHVKLSAYGGASYEWFPLDGIENPNSQHTMLKVTRSDWKYVKIKTIQNCEILDSVFIEVINPNSVKIEASKVIVCKQDSVSLSLSEPVKSVNWLPTGIYSNPTGFTNRAFINSSGFVYANFIDANDCTGKDSIFVEKRPPPQFSLSIPDTTVCSGSFVSFLAAGGTQYSWFKNGIPLVQDIDNIRDVFYQESNISVRIVESECQDTMVLNVVVNVFDSLKTTISKSGDLGCDIPLIQVFATGGEKYKWYPEEGLNNAYLPNPTLTLKKAQNLFVNITDKYGCSKIDSIEILYDNFYNFIVTPDTVMCPENSIRLEAKGAQSFRWMPGLFLNDSTIASPVAYFLDSITYFVFGITANGCEAKDSVTLSKRLIAPWEIIANKKLVCGIDSVLLQGPIDGLSYDWNGPNILGNRNNNAVQVKLENGPVYVSLNWKDKFGCMDKDSLLIYWKPEPVFLIKSSLSQICKGDSVAIIASGGNRYQFPLFSDNIYILDNYTIRLKPDSTTNYWVNIWDDGCEDSASISTLVVVNPLPIFSLSSSNIVTCSNPITQLFSTGHGSHFWSPSVGLNNNKIHNPKASPTVSTTYHVLVTDSLGCKSKDSILIEVINNGNLSRFQLPNAFTPNNDGLNDCFGTELWGSDIRISYFKIYNRWGQLVFDYTGNNKCWDGRFKGQLQPSGVYVYKLLALTWCGSINLRGNITLLR